MKKAITVVAMILLAAVAGCTPRAYEYKTVSVLPTMVNATVKRMTEQGWELVSQQLIAVAAQKADTRIKLIPFNLRDKDCVEIMFRRPK